MSSETGANGGKVRKMDKRQDECKDAVKVGMWRYF